MRRRIQFKQFFATEFQDQAQLQTVLQRGIQQPLRRIDMLFGSYCVFMIGLAGIAWLQGQGGGGAILAIGALLAGNILISIISNRTKNPLNIEALRQGVGTLVAPVAYVVSADIFGAWWPGFLIMAMGSSILVCLLMGGSFWGRCMVGYYVLLMVFTEIFARSDHDWYAFVSTIGMIIVVGLLTVEIVALLEQILASERQQKETVEELMLNILPRHIVDILRNEQRTIADHHDMASILFADIHQFTELANEIQPVELVALLNEIFTHFDGLADHYGVEKIKTIGDCYMVAAGVPNPRADHAQALVGMALDMQRYMDTKTFPGGRCLKLRIGINSGPIVAGVIGQRKFIYDLWGDAVNTASRMESHGIEGKVQITEATYQLIQADFECESPGIIEIKGKGAMPVWHILSPRASAP